MGKKFSIVVADPPYGFSDSLKMSAVKRGAQANYVTMTNEEIVQLPVKDIVDPDGAVLCLWVPSSLLQLGLDIMKSWSFEHRQSYIWSKTKKDPLTDLKKSFKKLVKETGEQSLSTNAIEAIFNKAAADFNMINTQSFGMGRLTRACHEICLIGINNTKIYKQLANKSQRSVSFAQNLKHSSKPEHLQDSLEKMFPEAYASGKCLEMFARRERPGWVCLGNEIGDRLDIRESLAKL